MQVLTEAINQFDAASIIDILLVTVFIYIVLILIRGTRAVQVLRGFIVLALILFSLPAVLEPIISLPAFEWVVNQTLPAFLVAIPVIFQPELRRALEQLGRTGNYLRFFKKDKENRIVRILKETCLHLSQRRHGALIVIERDTGLKDYIDTGILLNAEPSTELFLTVFNKYTELHDGAVIIQNEKVVAAACVMPLSTSRLSDRQMGLRHRAGLGISEVSDAIALIVSEETGQVSIAHNGRVMRRQDLSKLDHILTAFLDNRYNQLEEKA